MKTILNKLINGYSLDREEASVAIELLMHEKTNEVEKSAFISQFMQRYLSMEELEGFYTILMHYAIKPEIDGSNAIDLCGTGGDGKNTFNISTLTSFIIAGTGMKVIKHGNFGVSSNCGSSDVLQYLGYKFTNDSSKLNHQLEKTNICFLHAPLFHPALKNVASVRKDLGVKTFFNLLGPLINPVSPKFRFNGTFSLNLLHQYANIYQTENKKYSLVHTTDGYDEISLTSDFVNYTHQGIQLIECSSLPINYIKPKEIEGGKNIRENAMIFLNILQNKGTIAQNSVVLTNAAFAIKCVENISFEDAYQKAKISLEFGEAYKILNSLIHA